MNSERWRRMCAVFGEVHELDASLWAARTRELSGLDSELESEVLRMLELSAQAGEFLEKPVVEFARTETSALLDPGEIVAQRFVVVRLIGKGGMGEVYEATDTALGQAVALKVVRADVWPNELDLAKRLQHEILLARKISHPSVCRVHDAALHRNSDGAVIIVLTMELLNGETLSTRMSRGLLSPTEALPIVQQVAAALDAAHGAGVLHRDVKPSNIMLTQHGGDTRAVLTDFGLARAIQAETSGATGSGVFLGTLNYMAPEVLRGEQPGRQSDVYALGLVAYEMVSGALPHRDNVAGRLIAPAPRVSDIVPSLPRSWTEGLVGALQLDPRNRPTTAGLFAEHLARSQRSASPWHRLRWPSATALATVAFLSLALLSDASRYGKQRPQVPLASRIVLADFLNGTADGELAGVSEVLRSQLAQSPRFDLVTADAVRVALRRMRQGGALVDPRVAREVALREGASVVAYGALTRLSGEYSVSFKLELVGADPSSIQQQWSRTFVSPSKSGIFEAVHAAAGWMRETLGERPETLAQMNRPPEDTTSSSWQALQSFTRAQELAGAGKSADAVLMLEEAIRFDPSFATAHRRLGDLLMSLRREREGFAAWAEAVRLNDHQQLTTRETLRTRAQYLEDSGDLPSAEKAYRTYLLRFPEDHASTVFLGSVLMDQGRSAEASPWFVRAATMKPTDHVALTHLTRSLLDQGRTQEALSQIAKLRRLGADEWAMWLEGLERFINADVTGALRSVQPLRNSADPQWRSRAFSVRAAWHLEQGEAAMATSELLNGIDFDASNGFREREADKWLFLATLRCKQGGSVDCIDACHNAIRVASPVRIMRAGVLLIAAGRVADARRLMNEFAGQPDVPRARAARLRLAGELQLADGKPDTAVRTLESAFALMPSRFERVSLARARRAAGDLDGARRALAAYVSHPVWAYLTPEAEWPGVRSAALEEYALTLDGLHLDSAPHRNELARLRSTPREPHLTQ